MRPLLSITFPQGFRISKKYWTSDFGKWGQKRPLNGTSKVNRRTDGQTDGRTDRRTFRLIESIGPEGRCFENICSLWQRKNNKSLDQRPKPSAGARSWPA